jgi:hypothetical protein
MSAAPKKGVKALPLNGMKKQQIKDLTAQVAISTASMAKYNAPIPGQFIFILILILIFIFICVWEM